MKSVSGKEFAKILEKRMDCGFKAVIIFTAGLTVTREFLFRFIAINL